MENSEEVTYLKISLTSCVVSTAKNALWSEVTPVQEEEEEEAAEEEGGCIVRVLFCSLSFSSSFGTSRRALDASGDLDRILFPDWDPD